MAFCERCGSQNLAINSFCSSCGAPITSINSNDQSGVAQALPRESLETMAMTCAILGVIGGGLLALGWVARSSPSFFFPSVRTPQRGVDPPEKVEGSQRDEADPHPRELASSWCFEQ